YLLAFFVMFLGAIFWFFAAPGIRFGYGPLIALCALTVAPFLLQLIAKHEKVLGFFSTTLLVLLVVFQLYTLWFSFDASTFRQRWLLPLDYPPSVASECDLDGITIHCRPDGILWTQCFYDVFPCATLHRLDTKMRGAAFQDGFRSGISP
ncbi:MAG TPA: hypothetical protein VLA72_16265, partial [Anaerolineales bacterium]|nr:hypothetical protein [Anaerolineales bacterium]